MATDMQLKKATKKQSKFFIETSFFCVNSHLCCDVIYFQHNITSRTRGIKIGFHDTLKIICKKSKIPVREERELVKIAKSDWEIQAFLQEIRNYIFS